jgi:putative Mg2+ transporter-C (MgtC) family protein
MRGEVVYTQKKFPLMTENWTELASLLPDFSVKIVVALLCGLLLGIERERKDKPAGVRTIVLITLGSTLYMLVSTLVTTRVLDMPISPGAVDPGRIAAQVVSGIGFIGAGTIIQSQGSIHGLTTASIIWVAAGIGLCIGLGYPILALLITIVVLTTLLSMEPLRRLLASTGDRGRVEIIIPDDSLVLQRVRHTVDQNIAEQHKFDVARVNDTELRVTIDHHLSPGVALRLLETLASIEGVHGHKVDLPNAQ